MGVRRFNHPPTAIFLSLLMIFLVGCGTPHEGDTFSFDLPSLNSQAISAKEFSGKIILAEFWATWCGPCHIQNEVLEGMRGELEDRGVQVISFNLGESAELVRKFAEENPSSFPIALDLESAVAMKYQIQALPSFIVTDRSGKIIDISAGVHSKRGIRKLIDKADSRAANPV